MSKTFYDVYIGERNRTYLVAPLGNAGLLFKEAKERFKVKGCRIAVKGAWVVGDDLYLGYPDIEGALRVDIAYIYHPIRRTTYGD